MAVLCRIYGSNAYSNIYATYDTDGDSEPGKYTSGLYLRNGSVGMEYDASGTETLNIIHGYSGGAASNMYFKFSANTRMTLNDGGHLGLGTTTPNIVGFTGPMLTLNGTGNYQGLEVGTSGTTRMTVVSDGLNGYVSTRQAGMCLIFEAGAASEKMRITSTGNVGIGITTPCGALDTYKAGSGGSGTGDNIILRGGNSASLFGSNQLRFGFAGGIGYSHAIKSRHQSGSPNNNALDFFIWTTADAAETVGTKNVMTLDGTGNVGIGTCSPANALHIYRASGFATMALQVGVNYGYFLANGCCMGIASDAGTTGIKFHINRQAPDDSMLITQAGNVGINCSAPSYKLHVNGTFYAAGSSQDYKQSICNYNTDSCMFMKLKPVTYQYKEEYCHLGKELKSGTQIGLIAEEVAESHPELAILVNEEDNKVVRNVDYEKLTIILLSELQKLRQEVDQLKNK